MDSSFLIRKFRSSSILWMAVREDFDQFAETIELPPSYISMAESYINKIYKQPDSVEYKMLIKNVSHPVATQKLFLVKGALEYIETFYVRKRFRKAFWIVFLLSVLVTICLAYIVSLWFLLLFTIHVVIILPSHSFNKDLYFNLGKRLLAMDWLMLVYPGFRAKVSEALYGTSDFFEVPYNTESMNCQDEEGYEENGYVCDDENSDEYEGHNEGNKYVEETYLTTVKLCPSCGIPINMDEDKCIFCSE